MVVGLNRGKNNIQNTIDAAKIAVSEVGNLLAVELGNEPECRCILAGSEMRLIGQIMLEMASLSLEEAGRRLQMLLRKITGASWLARP